MAKKILLALFALFVAVFVNGLIYTFHGQEKSWDKVCKGQALNAYECASIYTMHTALWMFCWPASPAAANEVFLMQFTGPRVDTVRHRCRFIRNSVLSERVVKTMKSLQLGQSKRLTYNGNVSYALTDKEHKAAMAINPCVISREIDRKTGKECFFIRLDNTWPLHSQTHIGLWKGAEIVVQEGLFRYIQDKGLIHHFVDEYCYPVKEIL